MRLIRDGERGGGGVMEMGEEGEKPVSEPTCGYVARCPLVSAPTCGYVARCPLVSAPTCGTARCNVFVWYRVVVILMTVLWTLVTVEMHSMLHLPI